MSPLEERINDLCDLVSAGEVPGGISEPVVEMLELIPTLLAKIEHGEPGHRAWLKEAIKCHFLGLPMPEYVAK